MTHNFELLKASWDIDKFGETWRCTIYYVNGSMSKTFEKDSPCSLHITKLCIDVYLLFGYHHRLTFFSAFMMERSHEKIAPTYWASFKTLMLSWAEALSQLFIQLFVFSGTVLDKGPQFFTSKYSGCKFMWMFAFQ